MMPEILPRGTVRIRYIGPDAIEELALFALTLL